MSDTFLVKLRVFKREFLWNHSVYRAKIFRDNWNCYALLIIRSFISLTYSDNEKHMLMRCDHTQIHWFGVQQLFCWRILHCIHISLFYHMTSWNCLQLQFKGKLQNLTHLLLLNAKACFLLGQLPSLWARLFRRTSSANFAVEPWSCWVIGQVYSCSFSELKVTLYFSSCVENRWWMTNRLK